MEILALVLLIIWAIGILLQVLGTAHVFKNPEHPMHDAAHAAVEQGGPATLVLLTLLVVLWPAVLLYNVLNKAGK